MYIISSSFFVFCITLALYGVAFIYSLYKIFHESRVQQGCFYCILCLGFIAQSYGLYLRGIEQHALPIVSTFDILQIITWSFILLILFLRPLIHLKLLSFFGTGLAVIFLSFSLGILQSNKPSTPALNNHNPWVHVHAGLALFSYGVFSLMALTALMYIIQDYGLRNKRSKGLFKLLPALNKLESTCGHLLYSGVVIFSLSVLLGSISWLHEPHGVSTSKLIATWVLWMLFGLILYLKARNILLNKAFAWLCLIVFIISLVSLWPIYYQSQSSTKETQPAHSHHA